MPAIGAPLCKWTLFLLLCTAPIPASTQSTNNTAVQHQAATASSSTTTWHPLSLALYPPPNSRTHAGSEATCPFRTINYITHTLPQQCAKTAWSAPGEVASTDLLAVNVDATPSPPTATPEAKEDETHSTPTTIAPAAPTGEGAVVHTPATGTASEDSESELETESPLDNANFLSFEEWKMRNLAQVGQSPENVQGRAAPANQAARRRPVNVNALDSLGDEAEIELDFSGFGPPLDGGHVPQDSQANPGGADATKASEDEKKATPSSWSLSKDAGKTCKERFNYASFDCAATVLKTNKQAKSATSVLVENKDSYMLNECAANNKFLIVELCDDILVDTVVLANYEFFSSMFRHFTVSVSDRYPVKMERWKTLATFEARNSRDLQPFLITEPQIWARYLRIEFLTQYGNEFYCPLSLLRVHGTTMMEQFRREEEQARGVDDDVDLEIEQDVVKPAVDSGPIPPDQVPILPLKDDETTSQPSEKHVAASSAAVSDEEKSKTSANEPSETTQSSSSLVSSSVTSSPIDESAGPTETSSTVAPADGASESSRVSTAVTKSGASSANYIASAVQSATSKSQTPGSSAGDSATSTSTATDVKESSKISQTGGDAISTPSPNASTSKSPSNNTAANPNPQLHSRASSTQPNPATPSTQESFFKSIHKRLLYLEANSTLSLQYIEEQSRILRDAFMKVEKRQLLKTEKFLDHLNNTVMQELSSFRLMYDQLWQSTVMELESMKDRQNSQISEFGTRLSLLADELVWQKRMAVVQSTLLLLCLALVLFVRSGSLTLPSSSSSDIPIVQQLGSKYTSFLESASSPRIARSWGSRQRGQKWREMDSQSHSPSDPLSDETSHLSDAETEGMRTPGENPYGIHLSSPSSPIPIPTPTPTPNSTNSPPFPLSSPSPSPTPTPQSQSPFPLPTTNTNTNLPPNPRPSWHEANRAFDLLAPGQKSPSPSTSSPSVQRSKRGNRKRGKKKGEGREAGRGDDGEENG